MIALLALAAAATTVADTPLGVLPAQTLPTSGCAAYLFTADGTRRLVAVASAAAGTLRLVLDGAATDLVRIGAAAPDPYGFAASTEYSGGGVTATLDVTTLPRAELSGGATVPAATLRVDRVGKDGIVVPLVGLIGCQT